MANKKKTTAPQEEEKPRLEPKVEKVIRKLQCKLTLDEFEARADALAKTHDEAATLEAQRKATADDYKSRIAGVDAEASRLSSIVRNKSEPRDIECDEVWDWECDEYRVIRNDTFEVITCRKLRPEEKVEQMRLIEVEETRIQTENELQAQDARS